MCAEHRECQGRRKEEGLPPCTRRALLTLGRRGGGAGLRNLSHERLEWPEVGCTSAAPVTLAVHSRHQLPCASGAPVLLIRGRGEKWHLGGCGQGGLGAGGVSSNAHTGFSKPFRVCQEKTTARTYFT